ncbi:MAG: hypothetical protein ACRDX8_10020, partial [Acidimicrobiales bacterium]
MTTDAGVLGRFMVRSVEAVRQEAGVVDLEVLAVRYWPLEPLPGLLTLEDPVTQGLEARLPNAPSFGGGMAPETRPAILRLRLAGSATVRITLCPGREWDPAADGADDGILLPAGGPDLAGGAGGAGSKVGAGFEVAVSGESVTLTTSWLS